MSAILLNDLLQINEDSVRVKFNNYNGTDDPIDVYKTEPERINNDATKGFDYIKKNFQYTIL